MLKPILILGPTAGGKSDLAAQIAHALDSDIISADSMQIYRHMDAGTAKPHPQLRKIAHHHMIDIACPTQRYTVSDWLTQTKFIIQKQLDQGKQPVIVGGTNLYINSLLQGIFEDDSPGHDPQFRENLKNCTPQQLHIQLQTQDPPSAQRIHPNDHKRIIRALEVIHLTGKTLSAQQTQWSDTHEKTYQYDPIILGLRWSVQVINPRINLRVKAMFYPEKVDPQLAAQVCINNLESLTQETQRLEKAHLLGEQARQALGYKQVLAYLNNQWSLEDAFEKTKILTRRFAKTQRTWLKRFRGVHWIDMPQPNQDALDQAMTIITQAKPKNQA